MNPPSPDKRPQTRWGLRLKLILSMLLVGVLPLLVGLSMAFWQGSREIREVSGESFKALATEAARKLDLLVAEEVTRMSRIASDPALVRELEHRRDLVQNLAPGTQAVTAHDQAALWQSKDPAAVKAITESTLAKLLRDYHSGVRSEPDQLIPQVVRGATKMLFITDVEGHLVAALTTKPSFENGATAWWQGAFNKGIGQLYIEDVHFHQAADIYAFTISLPIMDSLRYEAVGVLHRVIDAKEFFSPSTHTIRFGATGHVMLIDSRGIVMSCPILPTGVSLSDASIIPMVTPLHPGWVQTPSDGHGGRSTSIVGFSPLPETSRATNGSIEGGSWHTFVWQSSEELFAPIQHFLAWMTVFGLLAIGLMATLGLLAATHIVTPIRRLQEAARLISRRELQQPIDIRTGDELQDLAEEITRMNGQLEAAFAGLTDQVTLKTQEVQSLQRSTDQILDAVPTPILLVDTQAQVHYINRSAQDSLKLAPATSHHANLFDLLPLDPSAQVHLRDEFSKQTDHASATPTEEVKTQRSEPRDPLAPKIDSGRANGKSELRIGQRVYHYQWFRTEGRPGEGPQTGLVLRDKTDESKVQDQLIQAEKSGSIGVLTAGIGHELNNPLFGILGLGEAIQDEASLDRVRAHARDIVQHGRRMAAVIRDFTGMAMRDTGVRLAPVDIQVELDQALAALQPSFELGQIEIRKTYACHDRISAIPEQIRQVFVNVLTNAIQAMGSHGTLSLATLSDPKTVTITIQDSGPGIPAQYLPRVFDPFFTTKGQGEGSGLGLTVAKRLVQKFGGDIRLENVNPKGSRCTMTMPAIASLGSSQEGIWTTSDVQSSSRPSHAS